MLLRFTGRTLSRFNQAREYLPCSWSVVERRAASVLHEDDAAVVDGPDARAAHVRHLQVDVWCRTHPHDQLVERRGPEVGRVLLPAIVTERIEASFYPQVLAEYDEMIKEYADWRQRQDEGMRKPEFYFNGATEKAQRIRRAATLTMCGYIFLPDSADGIGVTGVFQMSGSSRAEGIRYGEFKVLPLSPEGFQHGVLDVTNDLAEGLVGYRVRGHAAHTLKMAHRIILRDAVRTVFNADTADWAPAEAARAWLPQPEEMWVVQRCSARELVLQRVGADIDEVELVLDMAVHETGASSAARAGTVVPVVFTPTNEVVFERFTRCTRGADTNEGGLHGAQLLRSGDWVTVWTTPSAEVAEGPPCLVAARCWNLECTLIPAIDGLEGLAFDIVDSGTEELPTPLETFNATIAYGVVHRQPATVVPYLFSPTKTGDESTPGQGVGKTQFLRCSLAAVGPNLVDVVNDHDRLVKNDQFNDKGHASLFTIVDDIESPDILLHDSVLRGVAAKGAGKLVRMLTLEAGRLRAAAVEAAPAEDAAWQRAKLDAALELLAAAGARFNRVDGGSSAAAGAADAMARLHEAAEALPDVVAIVTCVLEDVADAARELGPGGEGSAAARDRLLPRIAMALYFLGVGVNSFDFVADMELGATVFLIRDAAGTPHWRYVPPFLLGVRSRAPACVALPSRAQVLILWLMATMPGPTAHLLGLQAPAAKRRR